MSRSEQNPAPLPPGIISGNVHPLPNVKMAPVISGPPARERESGRRWQVDLKWIFGIATTLVLAALLPVLSLYLATGRGQAEQTITAMSQPVIADPGVQAGVTAVSPGLRDFLYSPDLAVRIYDDPGALGRQIDSIPNAGDAGAAGAEPASMGQAGAASGGASGLGGPGSGIKGVLEAYSMPVELLSQSAHAATEVAMIILLALLALTAGPFIYFSCRLGRLVSPGVSLAVAAWAPAILISLLWGSLGGWLAGSGAPAGDEQKTLLMAAMRPFVDDMLGQAVAIYRFAAFAGLFLLVVAGIIFLVLKLRPGGYPDRRHA